jgi:hypothetical protein
VTEAAISDVIKRHLDDEFRREGLVIGGTVTVPAAGPSRRATGEAGRLTSASRRAVSPFRMDASSPEQKPTWFRLPSAS